MTVGDARVPLGDADPACSHRLLAEWSGVRSIGDPRAIA